MTLVPPVFETGASRADSPHSDAEGPSAWMRRARSLFTSPIPEAARAMPLEQAAIHIDGMGKTLAGQTRSRIFLFMGVLTLVYTVLGARLVHLAFEHPELAVLSATPQQQIRASRPDIVDRNGLLLATDVPATAVYADPSILVDIDDAIDRLTTAMPDLSRDTLRRRLSRSSEFEWIARDLTPVQRDRLMAQGIPGIGFLEENRRYYPADRLASHVLGAVNVDHVGLEGMERYLDSGPLANLAQFGFLDGGQADFAPQALSLDARVQHVVRDVLVAGLETYQAIAATAAVMDVHTGEVLAMVSLPDFDPNSREDLGSPQALNRASGGVFELGSVFKIFTIAAGLDSGAITMDSMLDARTAMRIGSSTINDFHGRRSMLSTSDVFTSSSNIGTIRIAELMGVDTQRAYYDRLGLLSRMDVELPGTASPFFPRGQWSRLSAATISFGHGLTTTPLQLLAASAATINGGVYVPPTFLPRDEAQAMEVSRQVLRGDTSAHMRDMFRANVLNGSGRRAAVEGLDVGGKTGTAEKIVNGAY